MSVLVVGISHNSAPVSVLERLVLDADGLTKLLGDVMSTEHVLEAVIISTCNRVEVYVEVDRFHGSVEDVSLRLTEQASAIRADLIPYLYVHYDDAAVAHLFSVASGLDSMVVGESQILGQVRLALQRGQETATVGPALNSLFQQALRVGKRGHAETGIDGAGPSLVTAALDRVEATAGSLSGMRALVVGGGAMAGLSVATLKRRQSAEIVVANRTPCSATRLAESSGGRAATWSELDTELARADLVISCTGATATVISRRQVEAALSDRPADRPLVIVDLALPHDVELGTSELAGLRLFGLADLAGGVNDPAAGGDVAEVRRIVGEEVAAFLAARAASRVTPTVVALRSMATEVVDAELDRLQARIPGLDPAVRHELDQTVRRVADKLLHQPTVRIRELVDQPGGVSYAAALTDLFALDPSAVDAVTRPGVASAEDTARTGGPDD